MVCPQADQHMRIISLFFSAVGFYLLLRFIDVFYPFFPLQAPGPEGGLIEVAIDMIFGSIAALIALIFATIHFFRTPRTWITRVILIWPCVLILGFLTMFFRSR
jgi:hypothetical protein